MRNPDELIEVNGTRLRVRVVGTGPAVLLIHGWALDLDMWTPQLEAFASRYRCIAFDRRGFGLSSGTPGIEHDVNDIDALLLALHIAQVAIVGMSQGARVALRWALRNPRRASCIVLDGPPYAKLRSSGELPEIPLAEYRALAQREGIEAVRRRWLEHPFMQLRGNDARARELLQMIVGRYPGRDLVVEELPSPIADLQVLEIPALVVNGEHDSERRRAAGGALASALANARLALIPQSGHLPNLDNAPVYNELLKAFFASQPSLAGSVSCRPSCNRSAHHAE